MTSSPIDDFLHPSLTYTEGLKLLREHSTSLNRNVSGRLCKRAHEFISSKKPDIAEKLYRWAVDTGEILGDRQVITFCSYDLAEHLENIEKPLDAIDCYRKAFSYYLDRGDMMEVERIFDRIAICYTKVDSPEMAISELKKADEVLTKGGLGYNAKINLYPLLIELLLKQNRLNEAHLAENVFHEVKLRMDRVDSTRPYIENAILLNQKGEVNQALYLFRKVEITLMTYGDQLDLAAFMLDLGTILSDAANYHEATAKLQKAVEIYSGVGYKEGEAKARKNLASNFEDQGYYQAALDEYRRALELFEELGDYERIGKTTNELGILHKNLNLFMDALRYYMVAREICRGYDYAESLRQVLGNLDTIFTKLSIRLSPVLARIMRMLFERGDLINMTILMEIGISPWKTWKTESEIPGKPINSSPDFSGPLMKQNDSGGEELLALGRYYLSIGKIRNAVQEMEGAATTFQIAEHQYDRAIDIFYEAGRICEAHGLYHDLIHFGQKLGVCLAQAGRLSEALEVLEETIEEAEKRDLFPVLWGARMQLSEVYKKLNQPIEAMNQLSLATKKIEQRAITFKHVIKVEGFLSDKITLYQRYVDMLMEAGDKHGAYEVVLRAKSWSFVNFSGYIKKAEPTKLSKIMQQELDDAKCTIKDYIQNELDESLNKAFQWHLEHEELRIWAKACEDNWKLPSEKDPMPITLHSIQQSLNQRSVIVDFFFSETRLYIFAITHNSLKCTHVDITQEELFKASGADFVSTINEDRKLDDAIVQIHALLREKFGLPLQKILAECTPSQVCFCPHGILHLLPVTVALLNYDPKGTNKLRFSSCGFRYLLETFRSRMPGTNELRFCSELISWYVPHASFFQSSGGPAGSTEFHYLGIGNPDQSLNWADVEVTEVSKIFKTKMCLVGKQVSRETILAEMKSADVIHFACHALLRNDMPELSYLKLGQDERLCVTDILSRGHTKAKLVILSACSTSIGRISTADEISSLARAFLYIGAEAVLATLWQVPDKQTMDFMKDFFHLWVKEKKPLRLAFNCTQVLHKDNPMVWSAFMLIEATNKSSN